MSCNLCTRPLGCYTGREEWRAQTSAETISTVPHGIADKDTHLTYPRQAPRKTPIEVQTVSTTPAAPVLRVGRAVLLKIFPAVGDLAKYEARAPSCHAARCTVGETGCDKAVRPPTWRRGDPWRAIKYVGVHGKLRAGLLVGRRGVFFVGLEDINV